MAFVVGLPLSVFAIAGVLGLYADQGRDRANPATIAQFVYLAVPAVGAFSVAQADRGRRLLAAAVLAAAITLAVSAYLVQFAMALPDWSGTRPGVLAALCR